MTKRDSTAVNEILEIRFHARAGQGAKAAAQILAEAALAKNKHVQAFPNYGPERRGAPVSSFVRISSSPISIHSQINEPDVVLVLDATLLNNPEVIQGLSDDSLLLANFPDSTEKGEASAIGKIRRSTGFSGKILQIDASRIAKFFLGKDLPNLVMLGAFAKTTGATELTDLEQIIEQKFSGHWGKEMTQKNLLALKTGFNEI